LIFNYFNNLAWMTVRRGGAIIKDYESTSRQASSLPVRKLRLLFEQVTASPQHKAISLGMGEPKHPTPNSSSRR
jgi:hypothetical protein